MATYYASTSISDGIVNAGTSEGTATSLRDALTSKASAGDTVYVKNDGVGGIEVANGVIVVGASDVFIEGYTTTPGDGGIASFSPDSGSFAFLQLQWGDFIKGIEADGFSVGFDFATGSGIIAYDCSAKNCTTGFIDNSGNTQAGYRIIKCYAESCTTGFSLNSEGITATGCVAISCTTGFDLPGTEERSLSHCIAHACSTRGFDTEAETEFVACMANQCGDGFYWNQSNGSNAMVNCTATNCTGYGVNAASASTTVNRLNCAIWNNTSGATNNVAGRNIGTVTSDPGFADDTPATATDVDLRVSAGSPLLDAGIGWPSRLTSMG